MKALFVCNSRSDFDFPGRIGCKNGEECMESYVLYSCTQMCCIHFHRARSFRVTGLQHSFPILEVTDIFFKALNFHFLSITALKLDWSSTRCAYIFTVWGTKISFTCLKTISGMLTGIFPKELVLFPFFFELFCAEYEYLLSLLWTLFYWISVTYWLLPLWAQVLLKSVFFYAFSCLIDPTTWDFKDLSVLKVH